MNKQSAGNGSLMRCLPVALVYGSSFMEVVTEMQSAMTHFDPRASEACILYNRIARRIISGQELRESIREEIHNTHYQSVAYRDPVNRPSGFVVDTFEWVLRVLLTTDSYEEVVVALTNEGSDSDTTSAIAGGLAGLYYGLDAIPERLSSKIIRRNEILDIAEKLYNLSGE
jgi:ADP-ribosyl-[dinitrogen reductase] hydrolase